VRQGWQFLENDKFGSEPCSLQPGLKNTASGLGPSYRFREKRKNRLTSSL